MVLTRLHLREIRKQLHSQGRRGPRKDETQRGEGRAVVLRDYVD